MVKQRLVNVRKRLVNVRKRLISAEQKIDRLKAKIASSVELHGVDVSGDMHSDLNKLMEEMSGTINENNYHSTVCFGNNNCKHQGIQITSGTPL